MPDLRLFANTSNLIRFKLTKSADGTAFTGLTGSTSGLIISTIADVEASPTVYTQAASHIQTIATLGTYAAPSASSCRFGEVDSTNHPGLYEFQFADARFAVSNAHRMVISVSGASGMFSCDYEIELVAFNPFDAVRLGLTALPNAVPGSGGLLLAGTSQYQIDTDTSGRVNLGKALGTAVTLDSNNVLNVSTKYVGGTLQTAGDIPGKTNSLTFTVSNQVDCNAYSWKGGTIPSPNVTGVPLVDDKYLLGTIYSTPATAGIMDVNVKNIANTAYGSSELHTLASHDPGATLGTSTLTQTQVTGGAYALNNASFAFNSGLDFTSTQKTSIGTAVAASAVASVTGNIGGTLAHLASGAKTDVENAVWDATMSSHTNSGSTGAALNAAGGAGDPWITSLPGSYTAGQAGYILGTFLDAAISSRMATFALPTHFSSLGITVGGAISEVVLVDTTSVNTDMRGTDSALTSLGANAPVGWLNAAAFAVGVAADNTTITWLRNVIEGDEYIDSGTTPWDRVVKIKQTGTELIRKKLRDISDTDISSVTTVIASSKDL